MKIAEKQSDITKKEKLESLVHWYKVLDKLHFSRHMSSFYRACLSLIMITLFLFYILWFFTSINTKSQTDFANNTLIVLVVFEALILFLKIVSRVYERKIGKEILQIVMSETEMSEFTKDGGVEKLKLAMLNPSSELKDFFVPNQTPLKWAKLYKKPDLTIIQNKESCYFPYDVIGNVYAPFLLKMDTKNDRYIEIDPTTCKVSVEELESQLLLNSESAEDLRLLRVENKGIRA